MTTPSLVLSSLLLVAVKASVLFVVALVATALLRRAAAATRHLVWVAAFAGVLALPVAEALLPRLSVPVAQIRFAIVPEPVVVADVPVPARSAPEAIALATTGAPVGGGPVAIASTAPDAAAPAAAPVGGVGGPSGTSWPVRALMLWLFGFVVVAVAFAVGVLRTHVLGCAAQPADGDALADEADELAERLGLSRRVKVVTWDGPAMPMTWGALRPVVLLPAVARSWPAARRREVLLHELAHVRRGDWTARLMAALICALHWFNPLAWMAARRLRDEQELACDDAVLASGARPSDYASHLLEVARGLRSPFITAGATVAMARPSQLTGRLLAVLDDSRAHVARSSRRAARAVWCAGLAAVLPLGAAAPGAPAQTADARVVVATPAPAMGSGATVVGAEPAPAALAVARRASQEPCFDLSRRTTSSHTNSVSDADHARRVTITIGRGDCRLEIRIFGEVRFTDDESDVATVPRDGLVRLTQDGGGPERRFEASWRDGQLRRVWRVDGDVTPETAELRAWLATSLRVAFARSGYNAVPRTMRAYRAGGLDSALALADATASDYARRVVLQALIDSVRIPAAEAARVARLALTMSSDYERAELLIAVAQRLRLDGDAQNAMVEAAGGMSSDYERRRVLTVALSRPGLSAAARMSLLRTAGRMSSDYEKAELLIAMSGQTLDAEVQEAMVDAASSMSSDHERRRVLSAALQRQGLTARAAESVLRSAGEMSSDYEKAELLLGYLRSNAIGADRRVAFFRAVSTMSSDSEKRRVLSALVARADASAELVADVCAQRIGSDYEKAELLVQVARRFGGNPQAREALLRAADDLGSDHERNRVLALLARRTQ